ncbi:NUDIX hydrolase [uncultured Paenalcaligenes sp.]|uniref:NUDIX hydrolase n=1 Tax=uncultured Paenalcaligenes sp. TaxID=1588925 RepID=UPI00261D2E05|nr:NUDIX hydrolase [uncultured Paenalcaligenes sp.]
MTSPSDFYFPNPRTINYCTQCANPLARIIPPDDNRVRDVCLQCGSVHYQNPRNVVGVVPIWGDKILLCKRAIEPRYDTWTLPAGFMELKESTAEGAMREADEEAGAHLELGELFTVIDVPEAGQVHLYYLATVTRPELNPGPESLDARFFALDEIPWDNLSFKTVSTTIEHYLADRQKGHFSVHHYSLSENH